MIDELYLLKHQAYCYREMHQPTVLRDVNQHKFVLRAKVHFL